MTPLGPTSRALARLGVVLLVVACLALGWEMLASQAPSSPWRLGLLSGPIGQLRAGAAFVGLALLVAAQWVPWAYAERDSRALVGLVYAGCALTFGALAVGAATGMFGLQIEDPSTGAQALFVVRWSGHALLFGALVDFARRVITRPCGSA